MIFAGVIVAVVVTLAGLLLSRLVTKWSGRLLALAGDEMMVMRARCWVCASVRHTSSWLLRSWVMIVVDVLVFS